MNVHSHARQKGKKGDKKREKEKRKTSTNRCRWRLRERAPPSVLSRRGVATPGVVSSAACAVILARYFSSSRACTCSTRSRTFLPQQIAHLISLSFLSFRQTLRTHLRNCIFKKIRDRSPNRNARENFGFYNCKIIVKIIY